VSALPRLAAGLFGAALVLGTYHSLLVTLVMPRRARRSRPSSSPPAGGKSRIATSRIASLLWHLVSRAFELASRLAQPRRPQAAADLWELDDAELDREVRAREQSFLKIDRIVGLLGPVSLLTVFGVWVALLLAGYSLLVVAATGAGLPSAVRLIGSSILTLGVEVPRRASAVALCYLAAASGLVAFALEIGYLPTIYGHYNRREALMRVLESRAGAPAWGAEILARQANNGTLDTIGELYLSWEAWSAEMVEAHLTFPWLMLFRSSEPLRSWITSLLAVLDCAAMHLALCPQTAPNSQARLCLRMGFTALRRLADALNIKYSDDPLPTDRIALTLGEFRRAVDHLADNGFPLERSAEDAWADFNGWRVNYESIAYRIAAMLHAPPAWWSGSPAPIPPFTPRHRKPTDIEGENLTGLLAHRRGDRRQPAAAEAPDEQPQPLVSVLTAAFAPDQAHLLAAYRSLCGQEDVSWEWLIQIDGVYAALPRELACDGRVRVQANGRHLGIAGTRNRCLVRARAQFIQNLDADDQLLPGALAAAAGALASDPQLAFAFGRTVHLLPDGSHTTPWRGRIPFPPGRIDAGKLDRFWLETGDDPLPISPITWRKIFAYAYGGWTALSVLEDTALVYAVAGRHPCFYLDRDTQLYRLHERQATAAGDYRQQRAPNRRLIFERLKALSALADGADTFAAALPPDPAEQLSDSAPRRGL